MKKFSLLLLDANIVIELCKLGRWGLVLDWFQPIALLPFVTALAINGFGSDEAVRYASPLITSGA